MAEGQAREQPGALTIERDCLKLQLLRVALPQVRSCLPKLFHVQQLVHLGEAWQQQRKSERHLSAERREGQGVSAWGKLPPLG